MIDAGALEQEASKGGLLASLKKRVSPKAKESPKAIPSSPPEKAIPPMPEGTKLYLHSQLVEIFPNQKVTNPELERELRYLAPVALEIHEKTMDSRIIDLLRELGAAHLAVFVGEPLAAFKKYVAEEKARGEHFDKYKVEQIESALLEKQRQWRDEEVYIYRPERGYGSNITEFEVVQRTDIEERDVGYGIREVTERIDSYVQQEEEVPSVGDDQFPGIKYEPVLIGQKEPDGPFEEIGVCSRIRNSAEIARKTVAEYLKTAGFKRIYGMELRFIHAPEPINKKSE